MNSPAFNCPDDLPGSDDDVSHVAPPPSKRPRLVGGNGATRRRRIAALPRLFFFGVRRGLNRVVHGLFRVMSVALADSSCLTDLEQKQSNHFSSDPYQKLRWECEPVKTFDAPYVLPAGATLKWVPVTFFTGDGLDIVCQMHLEHTVIFGSTKLWILPEFILGEMSNDRATLITPMNYGYYSGLSSFISTLEVQHIPTEALHEIQIAQNHVPCNNSITKYRFKVPVLLECLRMLFAIKDLKRTPLFNIVKSAWRISLPTPECTALEAAVNNGVLILPKTTVLQSACVKLDMFYSLYQRRVLAASTGYIYLSADASKMKGWNIMCARIITILWPRSFSDSQASEIDLSKHRRDRHLPLSSLGHGAASGSYKCANVVHKLILEAGKSFEFVRFLVKGFTSDQGVEEIIADFGAAISPLCNLTDWANIMASLRSKTVQLGSVQASIAFLFPRALGMPDSLHMIFGSLEEAVNDTPGYDGLHADLNAISHFLVDTQLKMRFCATCLRTEAEKGAFTRYVGRQCGWKWEYMTKFFNRLLPLLPLLLSNFSASKISRTQRHGGQEFSGLSEITAAVVSSVDKALKRKGLFIKVAALRCITRTVDRWGVWCEGSPQFDFILRDETLSWPKRLKKYKEAVENDEWRGCRAIQLSGGAGDKFCSDVLKASDSILEEAYLRASEEDRCEARVFENSIKQRLVHRVRNKLAHWRCLPYSLIAIFGCVLNIFSVAEWRKFATSCILEYDATMRAGLQDKLHRVAHHFLAFGGVLRAQLECFAKGGTLIRYTLLYLELRGYALIPVVCRRVEGSHAEFLELCRKLKSATFAWKAAALRRIDVFHELDSGEDFRRFLDCFWYRRNFIRGSIKFLFAKDIPTWTRLINLKLVGWWYQTSLGTQFRNLAIQESLLVSFNVLIINAIKPVFAGITKSQQLLCNFIKAKFDEVTGILWSFPAHILQEAERATWNSNNLEMFDELLATDVEDFVHPDSIGQLFLFEVTMAFPENKHCVFPSHVIRSKTEVMIIKYTFDGISESGFPFFTVDAHGPATIDVRYLCHMDVLGSLRRWPMVNVQFSGVQIPKPVAARLVNLQAPEFSTLALASDAIDIPNQLLALCDRKAFAADGVFIDVEQTALTLPVVEALRTYGILASRVGEFGTLQVSLHSLALSLMERRYCANLSISILCVPAIEPFQRAPMLDLVLELKRRGWEKTLISESYTAAGPKDFSLLMVTQSKLYFACLLQADVIFKKGIRFIAAAMYDSYYKCLLQLQD
jgi:hypothetical protein